MYKGCKERQWLAGVKGRNSQESTSTTKSTIDSNGRLCQLQMASSECAKEKVRNGRSVKRLFVVSGAALF